jgi:hypothetical protein
MFLLVSMLTEIIFPTFALALTSGPNQPEFSSFEPVATTNMVNEFTGDFTYNLPVLEVPGPHGSGYAMSLSYHSGVSPEEEASWVGYGWTLNPGAINRNTRGFPDDYKNDGVLYHNQVPENWTVTSGVSVAEPEFASTDFPLSATASIRYNNYRGFGYNTGVGVIFGRGMVNLGYSVSDGEGSFSLSVSPAAFLKELKNTGEENSQNTQERESKDNLDANSSRFSFKNIMGSAKGMAKNKTRLRNISLFGSNYGIYSYGESIRYQNSTYYQGLSTNISFGLLATPSGIPLGVAVNTFGSFSRQWNAEPIESLGAYGYMYSSIAEADQSGAMDYYVEKETPYQKRDVFLGIPFNNADNFMVSGEGIGGGFRMYNKNIVQFRPNNTESKTDIFNIAVEANFGLNIGPGMDLGKGWQKFEVSGWNSGESFSQVSDEPVFFRFNNDLGGRWGQYTDQVSSFEDRQDAAVIENSGGYKPFISHINQRDRSKRNARSSYIAYNTNEDINKGGYHAYSIRDDINQLCSRDNSQVKDRIGEIAIFNEQGACHVYGLPVYSRGEKNIQYGTQGVASVNNFEVYGTDNKTKVGEERPAPYASSFLLTEIRTPDYIDRTMSGDTKGPSPDDFGGYTRFNYQRVHGNVSGPDENWYRWRMPYDGLVYHRNSLSDPGDDMGSVSEGLKEIYYLHSIETKTHIAIFTTTDRSDGLDAAKEAIPQGRKGNKKLKKLTRIDLYSIDDFEEKDGVLVRSTAEGSQGHPRLKDPLAVPIKSVYFDYYNDHGNGSQALCQGAPNATGGKLTLRRVWFKYHDTFVEENQISPYVFEYEYPAFSGNRAVKYPLKYKSIEDDFKQLATATQNPGYSKYALDSWGNYHDISGGKAQARHRELKTWIDQKDPAPAFDPAAWQLKVIKLPSGGQIHVQYEQKDYCYVQDKPTHVMVSLSSSSKNEFVLNTSEIGITSRQDKEALVEMIRRRYARTRERIYFKFLYSLLGNDTPQINSCDAEYITGYARVNSVKLEGENVVLDLMKGEALLPRKVCQDFVLTQRAGKLSETGSCAPTDVLNPNQKAADVITQLGNMGRANIAKGTICRQINNDLSYFRVPTPKSKRGGGVRVKRLLMYDEGLDGQPVLYGNTYHYDFYDKITGTIRSSGVATNEPSAMREENILVDFIAREKQDFLNKVIAGRDKKQSEGPIGESVFPAPSIGYRRVAITNIHSGKSSPGFTVKTFKTAYDHPVVVNRTPIYDKKTLRPIGLGLVNTYVNKIWLTQGFNVILNNMHGQPASEATYGGEIDMTNDQGKMDFYTLGKFAASTETIYEYFDTGHPIPMKGGLGEGVYHDFPGKEIDVTFAHKSVKDELYDINIEADGNFGIGFIIPIPFVSAMPSLTHTNMEMHTHVTSKVVRYPAILKGTRTTRDGIVHRTENLVFDKYTGKPLVVRSYDEFKGVFVSQEIPASWEYESMKPKAMDEKKVIAGVNLGNDDKGDFLSFATGDVCELMSKFTKGDVLLLGSNHYYHVKELDFAEDKIRIVRSHQSNFGAPSNVNQVTIIRSGKTNQLHAQAGNILFHNKELRLDLPAWADEPRWAPHSFATALTTRVNGLKAQSGNAIGSFELSGTFNNMNIENYQEYIPGSCDVNLTNASISQVTFYYDKTDNYIEIKLKSFKLPCSSEPIDCNTVRSNNITAPL